MKGRRLELAIAVILAAVWGAVLAALHWDGGLRTLERIEATATDLRMAFRGTRTPPDRVTVVAIDDETVRVDGSYPVSRATLAQIIDAVAALGPSAVAVDLLLVDPGNAVEDARLAQALGRVPSVIAAAAVYAGGTQTIAATGNAALDRIPRAERFLLPLPQFAAAAAVGVVNVGTDDAGRPRFFPMLFRTEDRIEASLPLRAAALGVGAVPDVGPDGVTIDGRIVRTDLGHILPINFYGPRGTIRTVSAASLLRGDVASADIEGRVVVIGATVTGGGDVFPTPFDPVLPGVEVIATAVTQLMAGDGLIRTPGTRRVDAAVAVVLPALLVALLWWRRSVMGIFAMLGVMLAWLAANAAAFAQGIWFGAALPLAAALPPLVVFALAQIWLARRSSQHFAAQSRALQRFHAPALAELLVRDPGFLARACRAAGGGHLHRSVRLHRAERGHGRSGRPGIAQRLLRADRGARRGAWRRHHQFHGRWRHDRLRPAGAAARHGIEVHRLLRRPCRGDPQLDRDTSACDGFAHRLQDRRTSWRRGAVAARWRQPAADHRDRRYREYGQPPDGSCRRTRLRGRRER